METPKHTPGPYECDRFGRIFGPTDPRSKHHNGRIFLAQVVDQDGRHSERADTGEIDEEGHATGTLLAAAPELLEACKAASAFFEANEGADDWWEEYGDPRLKALRAAIAKATGTA